MVPERCKCSRSTCRLTGREQAAEGIKKIIYIKKYLSNNWKSKEKEKLTKSKICKTLDLEKKNIPETCQKQ